jgi:hypothetical protein
VKASVQGWVVFVQLPSSLEVLTAVQGCGGIQLGIENTASLDPDQLPSRPSSRETFSCLLSEWSVV